MYGKAILIDIGKAKLLKKVLLEYKNGKINTTEFKIITNSSKKDVENILELIKSKGGIMI